MTSGGSSAGSGASVAAGVAPFAIGSDGGGSIRIPSALCGLFGMKASMGRVPLYPGCRDERYPGVSSWESIEHVGPMSRTVADSALMLSVITGPDPRDRYSIPAGDFDYLKAPAEGIKGLRVAYSEDWGYAAVDPEVRRVVSEAVRVFEKDLGCTVERADPGWEDPFPQFWTLVAGDTDLDGHAAHDEGPREGDVAASRRSAATAPGQLKTSPDAKMIRQRVCNRMWRFMARIRSAADSDARGAAVPTLHAGPGSHRREDGQLGRLALLYLHLQHDGPASATHSRGLH